MVEMIQRIAVLTKTRDSETKQSVRTSNHADEMEVLPDVSASPFDNLEVYPDNATNGVDETALRPHKSPNIFGETPEVSVIHMICLG
nr:hypothetical protein [uncultured Acetobacteroides sp.]